MIKAKGSDQHGNPVRTSTTIRYSSFAFRLDLSWEIAAAVATALKAEIPGLTTYVESSAERNATLLRARYACPCGEISGLSLELAEEADPRRIPFLVDLIKHRLRDHVRGEGNEPNF